jgi:hypothetical protein
MSHPYKGFEPNWVHGEYPKDSYRSIFKWATRWRSKRRGSRFLK